MNLFFIYDTSNRNPDEDPSKSVLYFYPSEELDSDRCTLYYQIIGIAQFLKATFSSPSIITLDDGSFAVCRSENYLLVLGGNRYESNQLLKIQLRLLYKLFSFFHSSITQVLHTSNEDRPVFLRKIKAIWTRCLSVVLRHQSIMRLNCHAMPVLIIPQAGELHLQGAALLNVCQVEFEVLAGAIFCQKMLLYTQLLPDITSSLLLINFENPLGIHVPVKYKLPPGVTLMYVYLNQKEIKHLHKHRCKRFVRGRSKCFKSLWSNSGAEGDVDSDCGNHEFNQNGTSQSLKHQVQNLYHEGSFRRFPTHLPCSSHRMKVSNSQSENSNRQWKSESCDLEFQCLLCTKGPKYLILSRPHFLSTLKRSNSETDVMCFSNQQHILSQIFPPKVSKKKQSKLKIKRKKASLLMQKSSKLNSSSSQETDSTDKIDPPKTPPVLWTDFYYSPFCKPSHSPDLIRHFYTSSDDKLLQECVLYVQSCGDCLMTLLLNSVPSLNLVIYLWHCGFSILPGISYKTAQKPPTKSSSSQDKTDFNIHTYNYKSKLFHGQLSDRNMPSDWVKSSVHEDFYTDPLLYSVSIMESERSICAYNTKEKQIVYEQPGTMHRKLSWFSQFWEKANRRTEKYLNITLPKF